MTLKFYIEYGKYFSEKAFGKKLAGAALAVGRRTVEEALVLYYVWKDPEVPEWAKAVILGALGYLISPLDAVPDLIPVIGYGDDASVLAAALLLIRAYVKAEHRQRARAKLMEWFPAFIDACQMSEGVFV